MKKEILEKCTIFIISITIVITLFLAIILIYNSNKANLKRVILANTTDKQFDLTLQIETRKYQKSYCSVVAIEEINENINYSLAQDNTCTFNNLNTNKDYYIYLKNNDRISYYHLQDYIYDNVLDIKVNQDKIYLIKGESKSIEYKINTIVKNKQDDITIESENNDILKINNNKITGLKKGTTNVILKSKSKSKKIEVLVTDLINKPKINNKKSFLTCNRYSIEEAKIIDKLLEERIKEAGGYQTRGAVVAAARFLLLEFPYRINYFPENGRLTSSNPSKVIDGEGRYYHKGLYLSKDKFDSISSSKTGPAIWGCPLKTSYGEIDQPGGTYYPNGLDCSGLISWILLNGGYDVGDLGAGFSSRKDLSDLGIKHSITVNLLKSGTVKAGDLIGVNGHIAIIIGIDKKNSKVYVAETLHYNVGTIVKTFTFSELSRRNVFTYIIPMDSYYKVSGNYKNMW